MQLFKKRIFILASLVALMMVTFTACDTHESDEQPKPTLEKPLITLKTSSVNSPYAIHLSELLKIQENSELSIVSATQYGDLRLSSDGKVVYTPQAGQSVSKDAFTYRVNDKQGIIEIQFSSDSTICEAHADYFIATKNTPIYDVPFLSNDNLCSSPARWAVDSEDLLNPSLRVIQHVENGKLVYVPPVNFVGKQQCTYVVVTEDDQRFVSVITYEVRETIDSLCGGDVVAPDIFQHIDLPIFFAPAPHVVLWENESDTTTIIPSHSNYELDTIYTAEVDERYYYIPYLENDSLCVVTQYDWNTSVDWNGIEGGLVGLGVAPYHQGGLFIPIGTPLPARFSYTLWNIHTGESLTTDVLIN